MTCWAEYIIGATDSNTEGLVEDVAVVDEEQNVGMTWGCGRRGCVQLSSEPLRSFALAAAHPHPVRAPTPPRSSLFSTLGITPLVSHALSTPSEPRSADSPDLQLRSCFSHHGTRFSVGGPAFGASHALSSFRTSPIFRSRRISVYYGKSWRPVAARQYCGEHMDATYCWSKRC